MSYDPQKVLEWEQWWNDCLDMRVYGYNDNYNNRDDSATVEFADILRRVRSASEVRLYDR